VIGVGKLVMKCYWQAGPLESGVTLQKQTGQKGPEILRRFRASRQACGGMKMWVVKRWGECAVKVRGVKICCECCGCSI